MNWTVTCSICFLLIFLIKPLTVTFLFNLIWRKRLFFSKMILRTNKNATDLIILKLCCYFLLFCCWDKFLKHMNLQIRNNSWKSMIDNIVSVAFFINCYYRVKPRLIGTLGIHFYSNPYCEILNSIYIYVSFGKDDRIIVDYCW